MRISAIGLVVTSILCIVSVAGATPFLDVINFSSDGIYDSRDYSEMGDSNSADYFGLYNHNVDFTPNALSVDSATLQIDYAFINQSTGSSNNFSEKEIYFISDSGGTEIGQLPWYGDNLWHSEIFDLSSLIPGVSGSNWSIGFQFNETTNGNDTFYLDQSRLFGEYTAETGSIVGTEVITAVPEPSTFLLLGGGLAGLAFVVRRKKKS